MRRRGANGLTPVKAGLIALVVIAVASFFGFSRYNPFHDAFTIHATFESANNLKEKSPVRVAGVDVGVVKSVEPVKGGSGAARVEMEIDDRGLPIHEDAEFKIRQRIFLEGNFFVDMQPGTAGSPTVDEEHEFPINQTATPVQFGQLLTALQSDTREDLQVLLDEYARKGLGNGGAEAYNRSLDSAPGAFRNAAIANEASLGTERHDLSRLIRTQQRVFRALAANPETLRDLVTNLNRTTAAFARENIALEAAIPALRDTLRAASPALLSINNSLPELRAFSIEALPGVRSSAPTIDASMPFVRQARRLVAESELKGLARDLRRAIPDLARVNRATIPFLNESRALSRCQNRVLVPFATEPIPDPDALQHGYTDHHNQPFYKEGPRAFVGLASESRINDSQWPYFHVQFGSGLSSLVYTERGQQFFAQVPEPPEGVRPIRNNGRTRFRPDVPCETQEPPNMAAAGGGPDRTLTFNPVSDTLSEIIGDVGGVLDSLPVLRPRTEEAKERDRTSYEQVNALTDYMERKAKGLPAVSPMDKTQEEFRRELKRVGLMQLPDGHVVERRNRNRDRFTAR